MPSLRHVLGEFRGLFSYKKNTPYTQHCSIATTMQNMLRAHQHLGAARRRQRGLYKLCGTCSTYIYDYNWRTHLQSDKHIINIRNSGKVRPAAYAAVGPVAVVAAHNEAMLSADEESNDVVEMSDTTPPAAPPSDAPIVPVAPPAAAAPPQPLHASLVRSNLDPHSFHCVCSQRDSRCLSHLI